MATIYAASCNPHRSARRARSPSESSSASEYTPLPPKSNDLPTSAPSAKRGRKPAVLSRTAREAQRKLNHSIIEKARRTKINEALATLKQLVPPNYGQPAIAPEEAEEAEDDGKKKKGGKREEKEKEFKLEILVRTVSFMQDLIERVNVLEAAEAGPSCSTCKRKRSGEEEEIDEGRVGRRRQEGDFSLPPISSWLPSPEFSSHLPSPPSSTHVAPAQPPTQLPPALSLGPGAAHSLQSILSPEEEHAASMLLEIRGSRDIQTPATLLGLGKR
ncbi:BHLH domain-containing protein [Mycena indigotica]|uniref:BHLH domain-containing protein n=1 Tax=Mycena indigotica TaxID=2126181 RepID=A0A8H6WFW2_9AGAR|nr:BHLH domain-containing protein [Mycena indigotica]KAF7315181.1 BHLH domain-containing protein [Mycena indigotica]